MSNVCESGLQWAILHAFPLIEAARTAHGGGLQGLLSQHWCAMVTLFLVIRASVMHVALT